MTAEDLRAVLAIREAAARIAADCSSILRRRELKCSARIALSRPALLMAHRELLWAFADHASKKEAD